MRAMRLDPSQGYKKSARVVGDVIGKFHPHGDTAVYDAMVRLAQDFSLRYPLVDGQGNFGNIDGDNAAAYRYTEARLTRVAIDLMQGLDEGTVDFKPTYNGEDEVPEIMPGLFPNLLANGASGIAVGMATSRSMMRWSASRRISRSAIRSSTVRAISAISTAIMLRPIVIPRRG